MRVMILLVFILSFFMVSANPEKTIRTQKSSVFRILTSGGMGTGFLINHDTVITNSHVVKNESTVDVVVVIDGDTVLKKAKVIKTSEELDLAVLKLSESLVFKSLLLTEPSLVISPLKVWALGFPGQADRETKEDHLEGAKHISITTGSISRVVDQPWGRKYSRAKKKAIKHSAQINKGNSGGPLLDGCGSVVGVNTSMWNQRVNNKGIVSSQASYFSLHIKEFKSYLDRHDISYELSNEICIGSSDKPWSTWFIGLFAVLLGLISITLALKKPREKIIETYTQYIGRKHHPSNPYTEHKLEEQLVAKSYKLIGSLDGESLFFILAKGKVDIGRSCSNNDYCVRHESVSRQHVRFECHDGEWGVIDLGSANGTTIDGKKMKPNILYRLVSGKKLCLGKVCLRVED